MKQIFVVVMALFIIASCRQSIAASERSQLDIMDIESDLWLSFGKKFWHPTSCIGEGSYDNALEYGGTFFTVVEDVEFDEDVVSNKVEAPLGSYARMANLFALMQRSCCRIEFSLDISTSFLVAFPAKDSAEFWPKKRKAANG